MNETSNLLFGSTNGKNNGLTLNSKNILCVGSTGSGKTMNYVAPNLMQANQSVVVLDPVGNLYKQHHEALESKGATIYKIESEKDFDKKYVAELGTKLTYVFVCINFIGDVEYFTQISNFLYSLFNGLRLLADRSDGGVLPFPVHFFLDEFQALNIPNFPNIVLTNRKYGIGISIIVQSITQLKKKYTNIDEYAAITESVDMMLFFPCIRVIAGEDMEFIQRMTGLNSRKQADIWEQNKLIVYIRPIICDKLISEST